MYKDDDDVHQKKRNKKKKNQFFPRVISVVDTIMDSNWKSS
jgi:hypothetical protein